MKAKPIWRLWPQKICLQRTFHRNTYKKKVIKWRHVSNEPFKEKSPKLIMIKWVRSGIISRMTLIKLCDWCWHYLLRVDRYILSFCHFEKTYFHRHLSRVNREDPSNELENKKAACTDQSLGVVLVICYLNHLMEANKKAILGHILILWSFFWDVICPEKLVNVIPIKDDKNQ